MKHKIMPVEGIPHALLYFTYPTLSQLTGRRCTITSRAEHNRQADPIKSKVLSIIA